MEFGEQALALRIVEFGAVEPGQLGDAARKSADLRTPVAEHHAAGAVAIDQRVEQRGGVRGAVRGVCGQQGEQFFIVGEARLQQRAFVGVERCSVDQAVCHRRQRDVVVGFDGEGIEVHIARRIEQAQSREMPAATELLRRRGQQDQAGEAAARRSTTAYEALLASGDHSR